MIEIGTAQRPARHQTVCGDALAVVRLNGTVVIALADGLGHGPEAREAAEAFCAWVEGRPVEDFHKLLRGATGTLAGTRGAAGAVTRIDETRGAMEFCGVGNIELRALSRERIAPICVEGIIGRPLRTIKSFDYPVYPGDLLVLHSDGISTRFDLARYHDGLVGDIAGLILAEHGKDHDDATCVVIRC